MTEKDTATLFTQALNVLNGALSKHRHAAPYEQIISLSERSIGGRPIGVAVYKSDPRHPYDYYTIAFEKEGFQLVARGKRDPDFTWKVSRDYLEKVVHDEEDYLAHPAKLDWDWLKDRIGLS